MSPLKVALHIPTRLSFKRYMVVKGIKSVINQNWDIIIGKT